MERPRPISVRRLAALIGLVALLATPPVGAEEEAESDADGDGQWIAGVVITSFAGAAFIAGTVTGALALHKHQQLAVLCPERACEPALHAEVDQFNVLRMAATTSIAVAGAALIGGVSLLLTAPDDESSEAESASVRATLAPGGLFFQGAF